MAHNPECGLDCVSAGAVRLDNTPAADQKTGRQHLSGDQSAEQAKHTPGPWRVYERYIEPASTSTCHVGAIAVLEEYTGAIHEPFENWEANARLIAASPNLLRVAHLLVSWLDEEEGAHKLCDAARAAIAKAEGRDR